MSWQLKLGKLFSHDTALARLIVAFGLCILGGAMMFQLGAGAPGYTLMEEVVPLPFWGALFFGVGAWGIYGSFNAFPYWVRISHVMASMYLWVFITLAQFNDQPLPTRLLLILPALVEFFVLVQTLAIGPKEEGN